MGSSLSCSVGADLCAAKFPNTGRRETQILHQPFLCCLSKADSTLKTELLWRHGLVEKHGNSRLLWKKRLWWRATDSYFGETEEALCGWAIAKMKTLPIAKDLEN